MQGMNADVFIKDGMYVRDVVTRLVYRITNKKEWFKILPGELPIEYAEELYQKGIVTGVWVSNE